MSALDLGLKAAVAVDGGLFGADLALDAAKQLSADTLGRGLRDSNEMETRRAAEMIRMDRLDQARRANLERLIRLKPDVYNMVGPILPQSTTLPVTRISRNEHQSL